MRSRHVKRFFAMFSLTALPLFYCLAAIGQKQKVRVDADSGNETDDIYALVGLLNEPSVDVVGVSSAHFNNADLLSFEKWNQYDTGGINT